MLFMGAVLTDLLNALDRILQDLLIHLPHAYGFKFYMATS